MIWRQKTVVGVDIGRDYIRCVELRKRYNRFLACDYLEVEHKAGDLALKDMLLRFKARVKNIAISLPYSMVIVKTVTVDSSLSDIEREIFLKSNIEQYFGLSASDIYFDYYSSICQDKTRAMQIVGARRDKVDEYLESFKAIGMAPKIVDVEPFVLWRMVFREYKLSASDIVAVVHFHKKSFLICIMNSAQILHLHEEDIIDVFNVAIAAQFFTVLRSAATTCGKAISVLFLCGEYLADEKFVELITKNVDLRTIVVNAFTNIACAKSLVQTRQNSAAAVIACNLAKAGCLYG